MLKVNKKFAKKYDEYRRKEELQKMKDRFGDAKLSEVKRQAAGATSSSSSSSESEDSDAEAWTPDMETGFLRVYAALQAGDSRLYDPAVSWFQDAAGHGENGDDDEEGEGDGDGEKGEKHKPMYYNEYHRKFLLEGAYENDDQEGGFGAATEATQRDLQEAEQIRKSLAEAHAKDSDSEDEANNRADAAFLTKRHRRRLPDGHDGQRPVDGQGEPSCRPARCGGGDGEDSVQRLHKFVSDRTDDGRGLEAEYKEDLAKLKRHWTSEAKLTPAERYLRDYVTKEFWRPRQPSDDDDSDSDSEDEENDGDEGEGAKNGAARDSDDGDVSADEAFLARQSEFEAKWNLRTEERDPGFESGYRRTFARGDNDEGDDDDDDDDEELFVVAAKKAETAAEAEAATAAADSEAAEAQQELHRLERRRQWKAADSGSCDEADEAAEAAAAADFGTSTAAAASIRTYPRRIADSLRQSSTATAAADCARSKRRSERRERRREEKLAKRRELGHLARMKEAELELRLDRLRRNAGLGLGGGRGDRGEDGGGDKISDALGGDFLEADFDPAEHDKRMANLFGDDFYGEGDGNDAVQGREQAGLIRRPEFSDDEELRLDAEAEAAELRRRLQAEVDRLHAEDFIRAGPGQEELRCRFNYRQVEPNDFGLSAAEILLADDRELNAWCSVRKASQYRGRDADWRDRRHYRSARAQERKAQLMPGMLRRLEAATGYADAEAWAAAAAAAKPPATSSTAATAAEDDDDDNDDGADVASAKTGGVGCLDGEKKRRRRQKKKKKTVKSASSSGGGGGGGCDAAVQDEAPQCEAELLAQTPRSRKRPKPSLDQSGSSSVDLQQQQQQQQQQAKKQKRKKSASAAGRLQISEQRLLELGIDPRKFHRMRRAQELTSSTGGGEADQQQPEQKQMMKKRKQKRKMKPSVAAASAAE